MKRESGAVVNACRQCAPLGVALALAGIRGGMSLFHGSQGCATYIRRYIISHFREPIDIGSSSFSEESTIFGGESNLREAIANMISQYGPKVVGVTSTCLAETIGEDTSRILKKIANEPGNERARVIGVPAHGYGASHADGFRDAVYALVAAAIEDAQKAEAAFVGAGQAPATGIPTVGIFPGILSCADLRAISSAALSMGLRPQLVPDYSESLDGGPRESSDALPPGGTAFEEIVSLPLASAIIEFTHREVKGETGEAKGESKAANRPTGAGLLRDRFALPYWALRIPIGIEATDAFFDALMSSSPSATNLPDSIARERGRLIDAYADAHKYLFGLSVCVYGEAALVVALSAFLAEVGAIPAICVSSNGSCGLSPALAEVLPATRSASATIIEEADFDDIERAMEDAGIDLMIGNGKGSKIAARYGIPLVRVGFPVHDRFGGQRIETCLYSGSQRLLDRVVNAIIEKRSSDFSESSGERGLRMPDGGPILHSYA